jgi:hypothetical protein
METMADILADTKRYRAEAIKMLQAVKAGARLAHGMSRDEAIQILTENIAQYDRVLHRYGWRDDDAARP